MKVKIGNWKAVFVIMIVATLFQLPGVFGALNYTQLISDLNPEAWWPLTADGDDISGNGHNTNAGTGPANGFVSTIIPIAPFSSASNWSTDTYDYPDDPRFNTGGGYLGTERALSVWILPYLIDTSGNGRGIWTEGGGTNSLNLYTYNNGATDLVYCNADEAGGTDFVSYPLTEGQIYHIGCMFDFAGGRIDMYVNGVLVDSDTSLAVGNALSSHGNDCAIGGVDQNTKNHNDVALSGFFDGVIADLVYWSDGSVITAQNFSDIFEAGLGDINVTLHAPQDNYTSTSSSVDLTFNATITNGWSLDNCSFWHNATGTWHLNQTQNVTGATNVTNFTLTGISNTDFIWTISCYSDVGLSGTAENRSVRIDSLGPLLDILDPQPTNISANELSFNVSSDEGVSSCLFSFDSFSSNYTMNQVNETFFSYLNGSINEGTQTASFWCNDTLGNVNNTEEVIFTIDRTFPLINFLSQTLTIGSYAQTSIWGNVSSSDSVGLHSIFIYLYNSTGIVGQSSSPSSPLFSNFTDLGEGTYYLNASVNDTAGNLNSTETREIILDFSSPFMSILYPLNISYGSNVTQLNYSVSDPSLDSCWYSLDGGATNISHPSCNGSIDGLSSGGGFFEWIVWANDTLGNVGEGTIYFSVSSDLPTIFIKRPLQSYNYTSNISLNYTATDPDLDSCWYNLDEGANISLTCGVNVSVLLLEDGQHSVYVWANDTFGNYAFKVIGFGIDRSAPDINATYPANNTLTNQNSLNLTATINDTFGLGNATLFVYNETGLVNETTIDLAGTIEATVGIIVNFLDEIYTWFYRTFDLFGNVNDSENQTLTIDTALPQVNLLSLPNGTVVEEAIYLSGNFTDATGLLNATLFVWNSTGFQEIQNSQSLSGTADFLNLSASVSSAGDYTWNYYVCDQAHNCNWNATNYSFTYSPWISYVSMYEIIGEWGNVSSLNESSWAFVRFNHTFNQTPVVVHFPDYDYNYNNNPCFTRIVNVTTEGFYLRAESWSDTGDCSFGGALNAYWLAAEKGTYNVSNDGTALRTIEVNNFTMDYNYCGTGAPTSDWTFTQNQRSFNYAWNNQPLVLSGVQTANDPDPITYYQRGCTVTNEDTWDTSCVEIGMNGLENDGATQPCTLHTSNEEGGYIAWEMDAGWTDAESRDNFGNTSDGTLQFAWEAFWESDNVAGIGNDAFPLDSYAVTLLDSYTEGTAFGAGIRVDGADGLSPAIDYDGGSNQIFLASAEDYFGDTDTSHTPEPWEVLFFGSSKGFLFSDELASDIQVTLNQPSQNYTSTSSSEDLVFNITILSSNDLVDCSLWHNATGAWHLNQTNNVTGNSNTTNFTLTGLSNLDFLWNVECSDDISVSAFAGENSSVRVDSIVPPITIVFPQPINYNTAEISFNVSSNEALDFCIMSFDSWLTNYSLTNLNSTFFYYINSTMNPGAYTASFWCNDSVGNVNKTESVAFGTDNLFPQLQFISPTLVSGNYSQTSIWANVSATDVGLGLDSIVISLYNSTALVSSNSFGTSPHFFNFTSLLEGTYFLNASANDTAGNLNVTETRTVIIDTTPPAVSFLFPINQTYGFNVTSFQTTVSDAYLDTCWYTLDGGSTNTTYNCSLVTGLLATDGFYNWTAWANDTAGNLGSATTFFTISTSIPSVQIFIPQNGANYTTNITLNYTATDPELDSCWYTLNGGSNISLPGCSNLSFLDIAEGTNTVTVWANDSNANNASLTHLFWVDRIAPSITVIQPENRGYADFETVPFEISSPEPLDTCVMTFDNWVVNYSMDRDTPSSFTHANASMNFGSYTARYWCNDTTGNVNKTTFVDFYVNPPSLTIDMLYPAENMNVTQDGWFNVTLNVSCLSSTCGDVNVTLDPLNWWNFSWQKRKQLNISAVGSSTLTNYPVYLNVSREVSMNADYSDLRFLNGTCWDGQTLELDYEIEYTTGNYAEVWVEVPTVPGGGIASLCLYYNNTAAVDNSSSAEVWNSEFGLVYHMNASGDDSTSNNRNRVATNGAPVEGTGFLGYSMYFDGVDDAWDMADLESDGGYWEAAYAVRAHEVIFETGGDINTRQTLLAEGGGTNGILMYILNGNLTVRWWSETAPSWTGDNLSIALNPNTSYHAVMEISEGTSRDDYLLFLNGVLINNLTAPDQIDGHTGDGGIAFTGGSKDFDDGSFTGAYLNATIYELRTMDVEQSFDWYNQTYQTIFNPSAYISYGPELLQGDLKGIISTSTGAQPFYTNQTTNPYTINLDANTSQTVTFWVNATGEPNPYLFFGYANITDDLSKGAITQKKILEIRDLTNPLVVFLAPTALDGGNVTNNYVRAFVRVTERNELNISFDLFWENHTLYRQNTSTSALREVIWPEIADGTYYYNVTVWDQYGNVGSTETREIHVDHTPPNLTLVYPPNNTNFTGYNISRFSFIVSDLNVVNCSLYGDWNGGWHLNQSQIAQQGIEDNFTWVNVSDNGHYQWSVRCNDWFGNTNQSENLTFSAFNLVGTFFDSSFNITQTANDATGDVILYWAEVTNREGYQILYTTNLSANFSSLGFSTNPNYTDTNAGDDRRRFYRVRAFNPISENSSNKLVGKTVYYLQRVAGVNTRNWINFYLKDLNVTTANDTLEDLENLTTVTYWNGTVQQRVTCNRFSCPVGVFCTATNCDFNVTEGYGYEVNINSTTSDLQVNWSYVGELKNSTTLDLFKNSSSFGINWVGLYANTSLVTAIDLIENISNADAVSKWDSAAQSSKGLIPNPFPWIPGNYLGDFNLEIEEGYEVSVTADQTWDQI